jgi:IclR family acetate operon transcriptional repressor
MSHALTSRHALLMGIRPILHALVDEINETVHVATLSGSLVAYIDCVESRKSERETPRTGRAMPSYATASGKALLTGPIAVCDRITLSRDSCAAHPAHSFDSREVLQDISRTTSRGFATNEHESQVGFFSYGSLVKTKVGAQSVAIVVAAPSQRFRKNRTRFADQLCKAAEEAGRALNA